MDACEHAVCGEWREGPLLSCNWLTACLAANSDMPSSLILQEVGSDRLHIMWSLYLVLHALGTARKLQGHLCLLGKRHRWADVADQHGLGVAAQRLLPRPGKPDPWGC